MNIKTLSAFSNPNIISKDITDTPSSGTVVKTDYYEPHYYEDPTFPVIFHRDTKDNLQVFVPHWHQNPELLYFTKGSASITIATEVVSASEGDIIIIPSNALHNIAADNTVEYYCLIPDLEFCKGFGIAPDAIDFIHKIHDINLTKKMDTIITEFERQAEYYKPIILSEIVSMLSYTARYHTAPSPVCLGKTHAAQLEMVKKAFLYINKHYFEEITLDSLADYVGVTRYYFCHIFKQLTDMTPVSYINYIRCKKAKELLSSKGQSVSQTAEQCGFSNLSYFTRTYKKYNGCLPSKDMRSSDI